MIFGLRFSAWYWWNKKSMLCEVHNFWFHHSKSMLHKLHFFFDFNPLLWTGSLPTSHCSTITSSLYVRSCWMPSLNATVFLINLLCGATVLLSQLPKSKKKLNNLFRIKCMTIIAFNLNIKRRYSSSFTHLGFHVKIS